MENEHPFRPLFVEVEIPDRPLRGRWTYYTALDELYTPCGIILGMRIRVRFQIKARSRD